MPIKQNDQNGNAADYKKGLDYLTFAISLAKRSGYLDQLGSAYCNMGIIYINQDKLDSGEIYINKALSDAAYINGYARSSVRPYLALGAAFLKKKTIPKQKLTY